MTIEYRTGGPISVATERRGASTGAGNVITGYAAVFNSLSAEMGDGRRSVREVMRPGSFRAVLAGNPDCRGLVDHNPSAILARTANGSLTLTEDSHGLRFGMRLIDTQISRDALACVRAGLISQCSFGFTVAPGGDAWNSENGIYIREIRTVGSLLDVSIVTYPAYPAASCEARGAKVEDEVAFELQEIYDRLRLVTRKSHFGENNAA